MEWNPHTLVIVEKNVYIYKKKKKNRILEVSHLHI